MTIERRQEGDIITIVLTGTLDIKSSPELRKELEALPQEYSSLVFDFSKLKYLTSAGLRVLLQAEQDVEDNDRQMKLIGVNEDIMHIFQITGFEDVLTIE